MKTEQALDRAKGCLVGLAIGDAIGTTLEFKPKGTFKPLTDMKGGGHFSLKRGHWTDDTSMALCLGHSLVECKGFEPRDQINRYCDWMDNGYMSSIGVCFDVGITVSSALRRYQKTGEPFSGSRARMSSGNGSIMRIAPVPIFYHRDTAQAEFFGGESSRTTHGSELCVDSCRYLARVLSLLINGAKKQVVSESGYVPVTRELERIVSGSVDRLSYDDLTGSGYVIESLESALWCFLNTECFDTCVLAAANLGNDADTTAAIAGQLAGAFYGYSEIRKEWREALYLQGDIVDLATRLFHMMEEESTDSDG